jgi:TatD DNase family protein
VLDSHCHLADAAFADDLGDVLDRAREAGVGAALCVVDVLDAEELRRGAEVCARWPVVRLATGVHPHRASAEGLTPATAAARVRDALAGGSGYRAIGEIGLDYHYDFAPPAAQREVFAVQVALAVEHDLPVVIHTREADQDTVDILRREGHGVRGVFHCFSGGVPLARQALDLGFLVSFSGIVTFPKATAIQEAARFVPDEAILSETDCPYLAPVPRRGKRNEPSLVGYVVQRLAELRGVEVTDLETTIDENYRRVFRP